MKFSIKEFLSKLRIWPHLLKKYLIENFIFCAVLDFISYWYSECFMKSEFRCTPIGIKSYWIISSVGKSFFDASQKI